MICSRARSLCTFTALVEIRCCGPSSCDTEKARGERERETETESEGERGGGGKESDSVRLRQTCSGLLVPGYHTD